MLDLGTDAKPFRRWFGPRPDHHGYSLESGSKLNGRADAIRSRQYHGLAWNRVSNCSDRDSDHASTMFQLGTAFQTIQTVIRNTSVPCFRLEPHFKLFRR